ncbi:uncharacterized protein SCHCODRAFT_02126109 [Schizophyllum commune H4-8]|uniref:uncharacterized protein n=1 Tax=Schizophyllum commune (strain H4-8 / FGSC 9210) TaxID=578458 RepID=UPI00215F83DC|nr:uncharacterized protein SCHCODRAFT_02126109 [Schizophyllum commune H4-8]KAI5885361.1 hypothetical protein SCHCODRAFT_02126109 [Schizophyllum commune H4-8]
MCVLFMHVAPALPACAPLHSCSLGGCPSMFPFSDVHSSRRVAELTSWHVLRELDVLSGDHRHRGPLHYHDLS